MIITTKHIYICPRPIEIIQQQGYCLNILFISV